MAQTDYDGGQWGTPPWFLEMEREVMGGIDFDPASSEWHQRFVQAKEYCGLDKGVDCLDPSVKWWGRIHLNPIYSNPEPFTKRFIQTITDDTTTEGILLVNASTATDWFQAILATGWPVCFVDGRIQFIHPDPCATEPVVDPKTGKKRKRVNRYDQAVVYGGENYLTFERVFGKIGQIR